MDARTPARERIARHRATQRARGLRPVVLWLPHVNDPAYRARRPDGWMALDPASVRRGTVVVVRLPRDKARPAVVVRSDLLSELSYATVLPGTTELRADASMRIDVEPAPESGLRVPSQVMVDWPQTVRLAEMGQAIGRLDTATMRVITRQMAVALGIGATEPR
jgi:mRNA interferase MazF